MPWEASCSQTRKRYSSTTGPARGHADLAAGRWKSLSLVEQLANVGSQVERAIKAHEGGDTEQPGAAASLSRYFLYFAVAARRASGRG